MTVQTVHAMPPSPQSLTALAPQACAARFEEAALNATVLRQQELYHGWLLRWADSPAKRVRSISVLGLSLVALQECLAYGQQFYQRYGLPLVFRLTALGPVELDAQLHERGFIRSGQTCVMSAGLPIRPTIDSQWCFETVDAAVFACIVAQWRGTTLQQEHAQRLQELAVMILFKRADGAYVPAALAAHDASLVGLFDIVMRAQERRQGYAGALLVYWLASAVAQGAMHAYLQVEQDNLVARAPYAAHGFTDRYVCWYRSLPELAALDDMWRQ